MDRKHSFTGSPVESFSAHGSRVLFTPMFIFITLFTIMISIGELAAEMKELSSGLKYEETSEGTGEAISSGKTAKVHYTGWLDNDGKRGTKFDSSVDRGTPFSFKLGAGMVIKGWDDGVEGMKKGGKRTLFIPSSLGYGERGAGGVIPPRADLIFDVELVDFN